MGRTQDNSVKLKKEVFDKIHEAMREETPLHRFAERTKWRNMRLLQLASHKRKQYEADKARFAVPASDVNFASLHVPPLQQLAHAIGAAIKDNFNEVQTKVVDCPDLREWGMIEPGLN